MADKTALSAMPRSSADSSERLVQGKPGGDYQEDWRDSDSLDLPMFTSSKPTVRDLLARWYGPLMVALLVVTFVATWASTIALTWRVASERATCAGASAKVAVPAHGSHPGHSHSGSDGHVGHNLGPHPSSEKHHGGHEKHVEPKPGPYTLHVPGFRLAYDTSYCNGNKDPEGAKARGCVFDPLQTGWMPGKCVDRELTDQFITSHNWTWFEDEAGKIQISQEEVLRHGRYKDAFTVDDYHYIHCEFIMKQLIRSMTRFPAAVGFKGLDEEHLSHCLDRLINWNTPELREAFTEHTIFTDSGECYERI